MRTFLNWNYTTGARIGTYSYRSMIRCCAGWPLYRLRPVSSWDLKNGPEGEGEITSPPTGRQLLPLPLACSAVQVGTLVLGRLAGPVKGHTQTTIHHLKVKPLTGKRLAQHGDWPGWSPFGHPRGNFSGPLGSIAGRPPDTFTAEPGEATWGQGPHERRSQISRGQLKDQKWVHGRTRHPTKPRDAHKVQEEGGRNSKGLAIPMLANLSKLESPPRANSRYPPPGSDREHETPNLKICREEALIQRVPSRPTRPVTMPKINREGAVREVQPDAPHGPCNSD